jgi:hypothetical protein
MYRVIFFCILLLPGTPALAAIMDSEAFINEFHYDNAGSDRLEFVEIACPEDWLDQNLLSLTLYNGSSGRAYGGPYGLDRFTLGEVVNGYRILVLDVGMQNGAPDGFALARDATVLQLLSYEGTFTANNGVAAGLRSTDVGVMELPATPLGTSLQLAGQGDSYFDFAWQPSAPHTRGIHNLGQTIGSAQAVPEPHSALIWLSLGLLAVGIGQVLRSRCVAVGAVSAG